MKRFEALVAFLEEVRFICSAASNFAFASFSLTISLKFTFAPNFETFRNRMTQVTEPLDLEWTPPNFSLLLLLAGVFSSVFLFVLCATESESEEQQPTTTIATAGKPSKGSRTSAVASKASSSRPSTLKAPTSSSHHLNACSSSSSSAGPKASVLSLAAAQGKQTAAAALKKTSSQLVNLGGGGSKSSANQLSTSNHKVPAFKESVLLKSKVGGGHAQPPAPKVLEAKRLAPSCSPASNNNGAAGGKQLVSNNGKNFGMKTGESDAQRVVGVVGGNESSTVNSFARVEPRKTEHFEGGMQPLVSNIPAPDELIISKLPKQQQ
ncbi:hypothetical protein TYRP_003174 [Tyrophagus putrescentiae]|nr:hypothetical protein TYRP_003174 [Tyrophagus putrescentiae]